MTAATSTGSSMAQPMSGSMARRRASMVPTQPAASTARAMMIPYQWTLIGPSVKAMGSITAAILTRFAAQAPDRLIGRRRALDRRRLVGEALQPPEHREEAR